MSFIYTSRTGTGFNTGQTGMQAGTGGGASPVLLPGLIGCALTGGPQQTLSSDGVVASGPYNLTASGTVTYGAGGAHFNTGLLNVNPASLDTNGSMMISLRIATDLLPAPGDTSVLFNIYDPSFTFLGYFQIYAYGGALGTGDGSLFAVSYGDDDQSNFSEANYEFTFGSEAVVVNAWFDATDHKARIKVNDNATVIAPTAAQMVLDIPTPRIELNTSNAAWTGRYARLWLGANAKTIGDTPAYLSELVNGGDGITDAVLAAYTG